MNNNYTPVEPAPAEPAQSQYQQPVYRQPVQPQYQQAQSFQTAEVPTPKTILILGIIGLAVSWSPFFGIGGIIISAIAMKKSNAYANAGGVPCGMSVTGRILARVGIIVSIVMTVFWAIFFTIMIIAAASVSSYYGGYNFYY